MTEYPEAVRRLFLEPKFELLPFRSAINQVEFLLRRNTGKDGHVSKVFLFLWLKLFDRPEVRAFADLG